MFYLIDSNGAVRKAVEPHIDHHHDHFVPSRVTQLEVEIKGSKMIVNNLNINLSIS